MIIDDPQYNEYYDTLLKESVDYPNPSFHQIELDLKRTFPEDDFFNLPGVLNQLRRIHLAYTKRNPLVGYC